MNTTPCRVLHVVGGLDAGGIESWLMQILRRTDRKLVSMDFLVSGDDVRTRTYAFEQEARSLGAHIIRCASPQRPRQYAETFKQLLREHGPYDVVHSHVDHYCGYVLRLAAAAGVPLRVAHSHLDVRYLYAGAPAARKLYLALMKRWIKAYATAGFATSASAAASLFGEQWQDDRRWRLLYCGIDPTPFSQEVNKEEVRSELGIPRGALVLGHVGRFAPQKNHYMLLRIAAEVARHEPNVRLLLVGDGPLRSEIEQQAEEMGIAEQVIFAGVRQDVPRLMVGAMDAFIFPSLFEGLGLVLVEAQAAGLPCFASDVVPREADVVGALVRRLSLDKSPDEWASAILAGGRRPLTGTLRSARAEALSAVSASPLNIDVGVAALEAFYTGAQTAAHSHAAAWVQERSGNRRW